MDAKDQGTALLEKMRAAQAASDPGTELGPSYAERGVEHADRMPGHYFTPDASDDIVKLRNTFATKERPIPVSDAELASYLRKAAAVQTAQFDEWFQNQWKLDSANPTLQRWGQEVNPEYYARREQVIDEQTRIQNMLAKIKLRGIHTREEIELLYMIDNGIITVPTQPIFNHTGNTMSEVEIRRGLFNPFRVNAMKRQAGYHSPPATALQNFPNPGTPAGALYNFLAEPNPLAK